MDFLRAARTRERSRNCNSYKYIIYNVLTHQNRIGETVAM